MDTEKTGLQSQYDTLNTAKTNLQSQYDTLNTEKTNLQSQYDTLQQDLKPTLETTVLDKFLSEPDVYNKMLKENISQKTLDIFTKDGDIKINIKKFLEVFWVARRLNNAYNMRESIVLTIPDELKRLEDINKKTGQTMLEQINKEIVTPLFISPHDNTKDFYLLTFFYIYLMLKVLTQHNSIDKKLQSNEYLYNNYQEFFLELGIERQQFEYALKFIAYNTFKKFMDYESKNNVRGLDIILKDSLKVTEEYIGEEYIFTRPNINTDLTFDYAYASSGKPDMSVHKNLCKLYIESKNIKDYITGDISDKPSGCLIHPAWEIGYYNDLYTDHKCNDKYKCVQEKPDTKNFVQTSLGKPDMSVNEFECENYASSINKGFYPVSNQVNGCQEDGGGVYWNPSTTSTKNCATEATNCIQKKPKVDHFQKFTVGKPDFSVSPFECKAYMDSKGYGFTSEANSGPNGCFVNFKNPDAQKGFYNTISREYDCQGDDIPCIQKPMETSRFKEVKDGPNVKTVSEQQCQAYALNKGKSFGVVENTDIQAGVPSGCISASSGNPNVRYNPATSVRNCGDFWNGGNSGSQYTCIQQPWEIEDFSQISSGQQFTKYKEVSSGKPDLSVSKEECKNYVTSLGMTIINDNLNAHHRPSGCHKTTAGYYYNTATTEHDCNAGPTNHGICIQKNPRHVNEQECSDYAVIKSKMYKKNSWDTRLKGCGIDTKENLVYFNTHETGLGVASPFETEIKKSPTDLPASAHLGRYICIGKKYAVVGFPGFDEQRGKAYIFEVSTGELKHTIEADDKAKWDNFGGRVAIGGPQGSHVILSAVYAKNNAGLDAAGVLYVFSAEHGTQIKKLTVEDSDVAKYDVLGESVDIDDGYKVIAGATGYGSGGAAYIFDVNSGKHSKLTVSGTKNFGCSVGISGNFAVVGDKEHSDMKGAVFLFNLSNGNSMNKITADDGIKKDYFGSAIGIDGNYIVVGAKGVDKNKGAAYVYDTSGKQLKLTAEDGKEKDKFGDQHGVSISGKYAIIGARYNDNNKGAAYIFNVITGELYKKLVGRDKEMFGWGVSIHGNNAMVGAPKHNGNDKTITGGIYFYTGGSGGGSAECGTGGQECIIKALTKEDFTISKDGKPQHNVVNQKYIPKMNEKECKEASTIIGGPDVKWSKAAYSALAVGCLYRPSQNKFMWNSYIDNLYDCSDNYRCVAKVLKKEDFTKVSSGKPLSKYKDVSSGKPDMSVSETECNSAFPSATYTDKPSGCIKYGSNIRWNKNTNTNSCSSSTPCVQKDPSNVSEQQCKAYAKLIGVTNTNTVQSFTSNRPSGCFHDISDKKVYLNVVKNSEECSSGYNCVQLK